MMKYFFTYEDNIPDGAGFPLYGPAHLLWLLFLLTAGLLFYRRFGKESRERQQRDTILIAAGLVLLEAVRILILCIIGAFSVYELPLHLCGLAGFICLLDALSGFDWTGQTLFCLCLPGTVSALIFPDWTRYPPIHFITIQGFLFHGGIVLYVFCRMKAGLLLPDIRKIRKPLLFLLIVTPPVYLFDRLTDSNYFFVNTPSPGSPLEWMAKRMGVPGYLLGYAALVLCVMLLMYAADALVRAVRRKPAGQ
jgi:hypothetical integral membrane protein (TIGR02206 family)